MDEAKLKDAVKKLREVSKKRNFKQSIDLVVLLKDLTKADKVDLFVDLHHTVGKKIKVCALVGGELMAQAKLTCDNAVAQDDFAKFAADKKQMKKLAENYDYFIAQANIMTDIAKTFGRVFGPRNKMPNPKAGCVVPPNANLAPICEKLQHRVRVMSNKNQNWHIQCTVGTEDMKDEELTENIITIYNSIIAVLPNHKDNYKKTYLKFTMSSPIEVD
jgi:large subunit ribosomal protein L1